MDLSENRTNHPNLIQSADADNCVIGQQKFQTSIIIPSSDQVLACDIKVVEELHVDLVKQLCEYQPEVIILATGKHIVFPTTDILDPLVKLNIGLEVLNNQAAARTFNVLLSEDREAVCLMLIQP